MSIGQGSLQVTFAYPAFTRLYRTSSPRLLVDGVDQLVRTWGTHTVAVGAGPHQVAVRVVPTSGQEFGLAEAEVTVEFAARTSLSYRAPHFHGSHGRLKVLAAG
ncbi:hypothetical protein Cs7R123_56190 [Catellatospora sp. TT07R-123]|uniref:hypothetical protein n=1 Tax=Catellatospora sp. TT07R-123 TaxID=2733863 RepID=UPI001B1D9DB8|nr:hypothetical protein [Catellatospora sp. TT07R-123]GHJ48277.1 hypothetical protein Cs7R123_56190 [Catellatospora sp. TT07R-123]